MTINITYVLLFIVLLIIMIQDVKYRAIHVVLPALVFVFALVINYFDFTLDYTNVIYNLGFIAINIIGLFLYFSFKEKRFFNPVDSMLGLGDILFFVAITPLFSLKPFILFFILGLIFSLVLHFVSNVFKKVDTIPLAGYLSTFLIISLFLKTILKIEIPII